ncbi:MAG: hypothetical protein KatS3mg109_1304 [Pirellulaceae bacterium]|nr:MAG: hypothetical protein KatS3mg109_1304 [Pirellulaceae bacterium]GIW92718.1 MAG: hypothetical protein KatS3mg110_0759 [Pirellulaceae bacterium]
MTRGRTESQRSRGLPVDFRLLGIVLALAVSLCQAQTPVSQTPTPSEQVLAKLRQRGTLILRDASLVEALFAIQENWGVNIVVGNDVKGAVNGAYNNAPLHEILDSILASQGYGYLAIGDSLVVMKLEHLGALKPLFVTETIRVENVPPQEIVGVISLLLSPHGKAHAVPSSQAIVVMDYPERIATVKARISELDQAAKNALRSRPSDLPSQNRTATQPAALQAATIVLEHADPEETARVVEVLLSPDGKVRAASSSRTLLVVDRPDYLELIRARVADLDTAASRQKQAGGESQDSGQPMPSSNGGPTQTSPDNQPAATGSDPTPPDLTPPASEALPAPTSGTQLATGWPPAAGSIQANSSAADGLTLPPEEFEVAFFAPQYVRATALVDALSTLVGPYGQISAIAEENRIVAVDQPPYIRRLAAAVEKLDVPRRQVRISALIFDASLTDLENIGINWSHSVKGRNLTADGTAQDLFSINSLTLPNPAANTVNGALTFMSLSQHFDVTAVINALRTSRNSRLLADPTVVVSDQESAKISIVTEIPYQQLTESALGGVIGTTAFREAGVTLEVTPHIARDRTVNMIVTPKFSVLTGFTEQDNQPIIAKREAQTVVRVANNQTLVIGGLRQRGRVRERSAIPYLADIKFIGHLFRQRSDEIRESELLVFLTPTILESDAFGTMREWTNYDAGKCELEKVRQEPCERCQPPEDPTIYRNSDLGMPRLETALTQERATAPVEIYRPPATDQSTQTENRPAEQTNLPKGSSRRRPAASATPVAPTGAAVPEPHLPQGGPSGSGAQWGEVPAGARVAAEAPQVPGTSNLPQPAQAAWPVSGPVLAGPQPARTGDVKIVPPPAANTGLVVRNPRRTTRDAAVKSDSSAEQQAASSKTRPFLSNFFQLQ